MIDAQVMALTSLGAYDGAPGAAPRLVPAGQSTQTNDLGEFRIFGLPPGEYLVAANVPRNGPPMALFASAQTNAAGPRAGGVLTYYPETADPLAAQPVTLAPGQIVTGINIRLLTAPSFRVSGAVVDDQGSAVAGAMVTVLPDVRRSVSLHGLGGQGRSDANGRFVVSGLTAGSYRAMAVVPMTMSASPDPAGGAGAGAAVFFGQQLQMSPSGQLEVTIADEDIEDLQIVVTRRQ